MLSNHLIAAKVPESVERQHTQQPGGAVLNPVSMLQTNEKRMFRAAFACCPGSPVHRPLQ